MSYESIHVHVTGFGPFAHIKVNPSSAIGKRVASDLEGHGLGSVGFRELETSIHAAAEYFEELEKTLDQTFETQPSTKVFMFHIGVHSREKNGVMRVEVRGYNELYSTMPDVRGVVFNHDPINEADGPIETYLESWFGKEGTPQQTALETIVANLNARIEKEAQREKGAGAGNTTTESRTLAGRGTGEMQMPSFQDPHWEVSRDAGRYLCNYCLYRSLKLQEKYSGRLVSVFIHVSDPTQGKEPENSGDNETANHTPNPYNPSLLAQTEEVKALMHAMLDMVCGEL